MDPRFREDDMGMEPAFLPAGRHGARMTLWFRMLEKKTLSFPA